MKPLYAKEIRLLQPAYLAALLLAVVPVWLLPRHPYDFPESVALVPFVFGVVMLALSGFGREFGLQTFALVLAQPLERQRVWRTKSGFLAAAILTVFLAWCLSCSACLHTVSRSFIPSDALIFGGAAAVVAFAGGLWTTLLLRQVAAAFWFTILVPAAIAMFMNEAKTWQMLLALGLYAAAGFWWARRQFLGAQETAWTGGVIAFPGWRGAQTTLGARKYRPLAALFWKELQLHQVALMGMAWLFLMHLGVVWLRRMNYQTSSSTFRVLLEVFGGVWLVVPWLLSSVSVAEERKLGTLAEQLTLPVSRRVQFTLKLLLTLVIGGLLSVLLLCTVEGISLAIGASGGVVGQNVSGKDLVGLALLFVGFAFVGFYASTLARNILQALAAAVVSVAAIWILAAVAPQPGPILGLPLWRGYLVFYFGWPALLAALFWLAWRNFRSESGSDHLWRGNALLLGSVLAGVILLTSAIYHRLWELLTPVDPRPGVTQIARTKPVILRSSDGSSMVAILPDGRLWMDRIRYHPGRLLFSFGQETGFRTDGQWTSLSGAQIVPGSNWVSAVANFRETVAIRSDGTLWISEKPRRPRDLDRELPRFEAAAALARFGSETNWLDVVQEYYGTSVVLLKQDGTLWRLGTNSFAHRNEWPGLRSFTPQRLLSESGWNRILASSGRIYAWKNDGSAWVVRAAWRGDKGKENEMGVVLAPAPFLANTKWRGLARFREHQVALREDGTLWAWQTEARPAWQQQGKSFTPRLVRISPDSNWAAVSSDYDSLAARKTDGSIWQWTWPGWEYRNNPFRNRPVRLGSRNDWLAIGSVWGGNISLGPDGSLYFWSSRGTDGPSYQPMLAPSRRPALIENIFARQARPDDPS